MRNTWKNERRKEIRRPEKREIKNYEKRKLENHFKDDGKGENKEQRQ